MTSTPFIGRSAELARLTTLLDRAREGQSALVEITGEAGIGKTRLVNEFARVASHSHRVVSGRARDERGALPYWPMIEALRQLISKDDEVGESALFRGEGIAALRLFPESSTTVATVPEPRAAADELEWRLRRGIASVIRTAATERPSVVILEDLHWADRSTLTALPQVAEVAGQAPVILILTYRPDPSLDHPLNFALGELARVRTPERIALLPFKLDEVLAYLEQALPNEQREVLQRIAPEVLSRTGGNPLFVQEVIELIIGGARPIDAMRALPSGVRNSIAARLAELPSEVRSLIQLASVIGAEFDLDEIRSAAGLPMAEVEGMLQASQRVGLIQRSDAGGTYQFTHALVRDAILSDLGTEQRAGAHRQIAEALSTDGARGQQALFRLADHYCEAASAHPELAPKAVDHAVSAAREAEAALGWHEAASLYRRALEVARSTTTARDREPGLLLALAINEAARGGYPAYELFNQALAALEVSGRLAEVPQAVLTWLSRSPQGVAPNQRKALAERALSIVAESDAELRARLLCEYITNTDLVDEHERAAEARRIAQQHHLPDVEARLLRWQAMRLQRDGGPERWEQYRDALYESSAKFISAGDPQSAYYVWGMGAAVRVFQGRFDEADHDDAEFIRYCRGYKWDGAISLPLVRRAMMAIQRGQRGRCEEFLVSAPLPIHRYGPLALSWAYLAELDGRVDDAHRFHDNIDPDALYMPSWVHGSRARLAHITGNESEAERHLVRWEEAHAHLVNVTIGCVSLGVLDRAVSLLPRGQQERLLAQAATWDGFHFGTYGGFDRVRGLLALGIDRTEEARAFFEQGRRWALSQQCEAEAGRCEIELAQLAERMGDIEQARELAVAGNRRLALHGGALERTSGLDVLSRLPKPGTSSVLTAGLSSREIEVLRLVAAGNTNRQIAEALVLSPNTVANHVKHILNKTGLSNRSEAVAFAIARGLATWLDDDK